MYPRLGIVAICSDCLKIIATYYVKDYQRT